MSTMPIAWTIAGSDSCAGAGIQADIKTMQGFSVYCASVITAVTAQNSLGVQQVTNLSASLVQSQLEALRDDLRPAAIKIGMVGSADIARTIARTLAEIGIPIVYDPVMIATSGDALLEAGALDVVRTALVPMADLITPNWSEAHVLTNRAVIDASYFAEDQLDEYVQKLTVDILRLGAKSVLIKAGHMNGKFVQDFWTDGTTKVWFTSPRRNAKNTHGTGCTLSSAITAGLAKGLDKIESIGVAKAYVNRGLRLAPAIGSGTGPLAHLDLQFEEQDLPWITSAAAEARHRPKFRRDQTIGFYPIVPDSTWVERLASAGAKTIQLRLKGKPVDLIEGEIVSAIKAVENYDCNLYINDYWKLALKHKAYGVHLGQEDVVQADMNMLAEQGLRLGLSTHSHAEVSRALAYQPSYIAIGPIFPTTTKVMKFAPQGLAGLSYWRKSLNYPLVAIGGIGLETAAGILSTGATGIAVVRDIIESADPSERVKQWLRLWDR